MSFSYRFHGNGSTLSWVDLYYLKDIDIIWFTVLREKRPRYWRDKGNKKAIKDEGSEFSVEFRRAFFSSTKTIAYFDIRSWSTAVIVEPSSRMCLYYTRDQVVYFASSYVCFGFRNCDLLFRSAGNDKLTTGNSEWMTPTNISVRFASCSVHAWHLCWLMSAMFRVLPFREKIRDRGDIQVKPFASLMTRTWYSKLQRINESLYLEIQRCGVASNAYMYLGIG
jgi:hypothetical protein